MELYLRLLVRSTRSVESELQRRFVLIIIAYIAVILDGGYFEELANALFFDWNNFPNLWICNRWEEKRKTVSSIP